MADLISYSLLVSFFKNDAKIKRKFVDLKIYHPHEIKLKEQNQFDCQN